VATIARVSLYGQEPEAVLLGAFLSRLERRAVIDVGAERGSFAEEMLRAGSDVVHVIDPEPANAATLRSRFADDERVTVHEYAASDADGQLTLHKSVSPDGAPVTFGHTVLERPDTDEIAWREEIAVTARSLTSLVHDGEIPSRVGILKVDTEGHDLAVIAGMGELEADVVMVEFWTDLPHSLGTCPWTVDDLLSELRPRGFEQYALIAHRGEFVLLQWGDARLPPGHMGNLVFVHPRVLDQVAPALLELASTLALRSVEVGEMYSQAAWERLAVIEAQKRSLRLRDLGKGGKPKPIHEVDPRVEAAEIREHARRPLSTRLLYRLPTWTRPRIGRLRHHDPRPLRVPASYLSTRPPQHAPTVTLVTPSYQQGRFLAKTIDSVVGQEYPRLEYVVQDGGSSDETLDVLRRFDPVLTRWASEKDDGQADAINRGFRDTTGEVMAWLNSDDLLLPGALAYVSRFFVEHPDVDVVYGNRLMIDAADLQIGEWILPPHDDLALTLADFVPQETLFWRRRVWDAVGGRVDPEFGYALDWDLLLRFRDAGARMVRLPRYLGAFRVHDEQKTTAIHGLGADECARLLTRVHGRSVAHDEILERLKRYYARHVVAHAHRRLADRLHPSVDVSTTPREPVTSVPG
jgi:FkbM family methyltransferase